MDSTRIKTIINFLRSLTEEQIQDERGHTVGEQLIEMGARQAGSGMYSLCYAIDGFIIKLSTQNLGELRKFRHNKIFKRFVAPVYWIHKTGKALICKMINFIKPVDYPYNGDTTAYSQFVRKHRIARRRFKRLFESAGFAGSDLHESNLVQNAENHRWIVIDYGCITGN